MARISNATIVGKIKYNPVSQIIVDQITWITDEVLGYFSPNYEVDESTFVLASSAQSLPVTYTLMSGNLPSGISFLSNGTFTGIVDTNAAYAVYNFTIRAASSSAHEDKSFSIEIIPEEGIPVWNTAGGSLGSFNEFDPVDLQVSAIDPFNATVTYAFVGTPPPGLVISSTGRITGSAVRVFNGSTIVPIIVRAYNGSHFADRRFTITSFDVPTLPIWNTVSGTIDQFLERDPVLFQLDAEDSDGKPLTFTLSSGSLPSGVVLGADGVISGDAPSVTEDTDFTFTVNVSNGFLNIDRVFTISILEAEFPIWNTPAGLLGTYNEKSTITPIQLSATDVSNFDITYSLVGALPPTLTLSTNGLISGDLTAVSADTTFNFSVSASNGRRITTRAFSITVQELFEAPVWITDANISVLERDTALITLVAEHPDNELVSYQLFSGNVPIGWHIDSINSECIITGTAPSVSNDTDYTFTIRASCNNGVVYADKQFTLSILDAELPIWTTPAGSLGSFNEGSILNITLQGTDPVSRPLTYELVGALPNGVSLASNGVITGTLDNVYTNTVSSFTVKLSNGRVDTPQSFSITTLNVPQPPTWNTPAGSLGSFYEKTPLSVGVSASDNVDFRPITYSIVGGLLPDGIYLRSDGVLLGQALIFANETYNFTVRASTGLNFSDRAFSFTLINEAEPPVWVTDPDLGLYNEGDPVSIQLEAYDYLGATVTYSLKSGSNLPSGLTLVEDTISGTAPQVAGDQLYSFTIIAANNVLSAERSFDITIVDNSLAPVWQTSSDLGIVNEHDDISIQLEATDPEDQTVMYAAVAEMPRGLSISTSGLVSGALSVAEDKDVTFSIIASNGAQTATRVFSLHVINIPTYPTWNTSTNLGNFFSGSWMFTTLSATSSDGNPIQYELLVSDLPSSVSVSSGGFLIGTLPSVETDTIYTLTVRAIDNDYYADRTFTLTSLFVNNPPVWNTPAGTLQTYDTESDVYIQLSALDANSDPVTYSVIDGSFPSGVSMNSSGLITGRISQPQSEIYTFTVRATDTNSAYVDRTFSIKVQTSRVIPTPISGHNFLVWFPGDEDVNTMPTKLHEEVALKDYEVGTITRNVVAGINGVKTAQQNISASIFESKTAYTVSMWVSCSYSTKAWQSRGLQVITHGSTSPSEIYRVLKLDTGDVIDTKSVPGSDAVYFKSTRALSTYNGIHNLVWVRNGTTLTFYVNGIVEKTVDIGLNSAISRYILSNSGSDNLLASDFSRLNVAVFDGAFTDADVATLYGIGPAAMSNRTSTFAGIIRAPEWTTAAGLLGSFSEGSTISLQLSATDPNNNSISYIMAYGDLPSGITLNSNGHISGTLPEVPYTGTTYNFVVGASNGTNITYRAFSLTNNNVNKNPVWITPAGPLGAVFESTSFSLTLMARDPDLTDLSFALQSGTLPPSLAIAPTGILTGNINAVAENTTYNFVVRVSDTYGGYSDRAFSITVLDSSAPPSWVTSAGSLGSYPDNDYLQIILSAEDINDYPITYTITGGSLPAGLSLSSVGVISGTVNNVTTDTTSNFTVTANNGVATADQSFAITIVDTPHAPVWVTAAGSLGSFNEKTVLDITLSATDIDSPTVTYSIVSGTLPSGVALASGHITGTLDPVSIDTTQTFTVRATDGALYADRQFSITVLFVNDPPVWITSSGSLGSYDESSIINITLQASDEENDTLTYNVVTGSLPAGLSLSTGGNITGTLSHVTSNTLSNFTVEVSDGTNAPVSRNFSMMTYCITPTWVTASGTLGTFDDGNALNIQLEATVPTGTLQYSVLSGSLPANVNLSTTGAITGTPYVLSDTTYNFTVRTNAIGKPIYTDRAFSIIINNVNQAPVWNTPAGLIRVYPAGTAVSYQLDVSDYDENTITFSLESGSLPAGLSMSSSGLISGTASTVLSDTTSNFTIRATDINSAYMDRAFSIEVAYVDLWETNVVQSFSTRLYVSTAGNDTTGDGTVNNPYATLQKATTTASNGTAIIILPGTHTVNTSTNWSPTNTYPSGFLEDYNKELYFIGYPNQTILQNPATTSRDAHAVCLRNSKSIVAGVKFDFDANRGATRTLDYTRALFSTSNVFSFNGSLRNCFVSAQGAESFYYNNSATDTASFINIAFSAGSWITSFSGDSTSCTAVGSAINNATYPFSSTKNIANAVNASYDSNVQVSPATNLLYGVHASGFYSWTQGQTNQLSTYINAFASKIYVSLTGNDTTGDGTVNNPYATLQKAVTSATTGSAIIIGAGTHTINTSTNWDTVYNAPSCSGYLEDYGKALHFFGTPGQTVLKSNPSSTAVTRDAGLVCFQNAATSANGIIFEHDYGTRTNNYSRAMFTSAGRRPNNYGTFRNCVFRNVAGQSMYFGYATMNQLYFQNCTFYASSNLASYSGVTIHTFITLDCAINVTPVDTFRKLNLVEAVTTNASTYAISGTGIKNTLNGVYGGVFPWS
jgi:hypothetical protein